MNCNTTHYRANSSSVPGDPTPDAYAALHFWQRGRLDFAAAEPQEIPALLLYWFGLIALAIGLLWFIILSLRASRRNLIPLVIAIATCIAGFLICKSAVQAWPAALEAVVQTPKMLVVIQLAAGLALAGSGIIWFATTSIRSAQSSLHAPLVLAVAGAVMTMLGFTPLPEILVPMPFLIMLVLWIAAAVTLNNTIWGRYMLAVGRNEQAALYSGVNTHNLIILAYVICSLLAGLGGMLFVLDVNSAQPADFGNGYELYAITAAVLGGCSLRGGEGTITGVIIGAAVMQILKNSINLLDFPTQIEFAIIGTVLLVGIATDVFTKRLAQRRSAGPGRGFPVISSQ